MKFDTKDTENYFYEQTNIYGDVRVNVDDNMIWTIEKVDNFVSDLKAINHFKKN